MPYSYAHDTHALCDLVYFRKYKENEQTALPALKRAA